MQQAAEDPFVSVMKNKSHKINWAMSLCAVAVFSFATTNEAHAARAIEAGSDAIVSSEPVSYGNPMLPPGTGPIPPSTDSNKVVDSGSYSGTVMVD